MRPFDRNFRCLQRICLVFGVGRAKIDLGLLSFAILEEFHCDLGEECIGEAVV